jgi:methionyl-tRNA synthetase
MKETIKYEDFAKLDLRVAKILEAEPVENTDKLLKLKIDIGEERQIVAGIAKHYTPDELVGKSIIVIANLEPAKIRGVESQGMLLAVTDENGVCVVTTDKDMQPGSKLS